MHHHTQALTNLSLLQQQRLLRVRVVVRVLLRVLVVLVVLVLVRVLVLANLATAAAATAHPTIPVQPPPVAGATTTLRPSGNGLILSKVKSSPTIWLATGTAAGLNGSINPTAYFTLLICCKGFTTKDATTLTAGADHCP
jgi:preprotein translocase subunit SecG